MSDSPRSCQSTRPHARLSRNSRGWQLPWWLPWCGGYPGGNCARQGSGISTQAHDRRYTAHRGTEAWLRSGSSTRHRSSSSTGLVGVDGVASHAMAPLGRWMGLQAMRGLPPRRGTDLQAVQGLARGQVWRSLTGRSSRVRLSRSGRSDLAAAAALFVSGPTFRIAKPSSARGRTGAIRRDVWRRSANAVSGCQPTSESIMDAHSAFEDGRSRRGAPGASPQEAERPLSRKPVPVKRIR